MPRRKSKKQDLVDPEGTIDALLNRLEGGEWRKGGTVVSAPVVIKPPKGSDRLVSVPKARNSKSSKMTRNLPSMMRNPSNVDNVRGSVMKMAASNPKSSAAVIQSFCLPEENPVLRVPIESCIPTQAVQLRIKFPLSMTSGSPTDLPVGAMQVAITNDPLHALIYNDYNYVARTNHRLAYFNAGDSYALTQPLSFEMNTITRLNIIYFADDPATAATDTMALPLQYSYLWQGRYGFYYSDGQGSSATTLKLAMAGDTWDSNDSVTLFSLEGTEWVTVTSVSSLSGSTVTFNLAAGNAIYAVEIFNSYTKAAGCRVSATLTDTKNVYTVIMPLPDIDSHMQQCQAVRINSGSLMLTNRAPVVNRNGVVTGVQFASGVDILQLFEQYESAKVLSQIGAVTMANDNGMFGFLRPTGTDDFSYIPIASLDFGTPTVVQPTKLTSPFTASRYLFMEWQSDDVGEELHVFPGNNVLVTAYFDVELRTTDQWASVGPSDVSSADFMAAVDALKYVPQFYENPTHFKQVMQKIMGALKSAAPILIPALIKVLELYHPAAAAALRPIAAAFV